jgi:hypothetical protein
MKNTKSFKKAWEYALENRLSSRTAISELEFSHSTYDPIERYKSVVAKRFGESMMDLGKISFERDFFHDQFLHGRDYYGERTYISESHVFTREELEELLEKFGDNLMQEFPMR